MTKLQRSECMRRIKSTDTMAELAVRRMLHRSGYRFRLYRDDLPGKPDLVLPRYRTALFVHGCFWHGHAGCIDGHSPKSNTAYWTPKLERNRRRDAEALQQLTARGWRVVVIWECETRHVDRLCERLAAIPQASSAAIPEDTSGRPPSLDEPG